MGFLFFPMMPMGLHLASCIVNESLLCGIFPEKLKLAKVTPVFKKGSTQDEDNNYYLRNRKHVLCFYRVLVYIYWRSITNAVLWLATLLTIYSVIDSE